MSNVSSRLKAERKALFRISTTLTLCIIANTCLAQEYNRKLIRQLGSDQFVEREDAQQALMELSVPPIDLLREAAESSDLEIAYRARKILQIRDPRVKALKWLQQIDPKTYAKWKPEDVEKTTKLDLRSKEVPTLTWFIWSVLHS